MNVSLIIFLTLAYVVFVLASFVWLVGNVEDVLEQEYPKLIDKKWKRLLWLISCLLFIPYLVTMTGFPVYVIGEIRRFFSPAAKENKEKHEKKEDCK